MVQPHVEDLNDATNTNARTYSARAPAPRTLSLPITATSPITIGTQNPNIYQYNFTQELRLTGGDSDSWLRYTLGIYYSRSRVFTDLPITLPPYKALYLTRNGVAAPRGPVYGRRRDLLRGREHGREGPVLLSPTSTSSWSTG
ncbi:MAG: hypothetical protein WDN24_11940 [Sphingomonas sp.]